MNEYVIRPTLQEIETALDGGKLWIAINNGKYWVARRNGATRRWKRNPGRFYVPFKYGFRECGALTETDVASFGAPPAWFVINDGRPRTMAVFGGNDGA